MSVRLRKKPAGSAAAAHPPSAAVLSTESQAFYAELREGYLAAFAPVNQVEEDLVDRLVACQWRLQRTVTMETAAINLAMRDGKHRFTELYGSISQVTHAALAIHVIESTSGSLSALHRDEARLAKRYGEALRQLLRLQAKRG